MVARLERLIGIKTEKYFIWPPLWKMSLQLLVHLKHTMRYAHDSQTLNKSKSVTHSNFVWVILKSLVIFALSDRLLSKRCIRKSYDHFLHWNRILSAWCRHCMISNGCNEVMIQIRVAQLFCRPNCISFSPIVTYLCHLSWFPVSVSYIHRN